MVNKWKKVTCSRNIKEEIFVIILWKAFKEEAI